MSEFQQRSGESIGQHRDRLASAVGKLGPKCECEICTRGKRLRAVAGKLDEDDAKWLIELGGDLAGAEMDCEVNAAIMDGSWDSSVWILERALKRAREKQTAETT